MKYRHSLAYANKHDAPTVKWVVGLGYRRPQWQDNNSALGLRPTFIAMMPRQVIRPAGLAKGSSRHRNAVAVSLFPEVSTPLIDTSPWVGAPDGRNGLRTKGNGMLSHPSMKHGKRCVFDAGTGVFPWGHILGLLWLFCYPSPSFLLASGCVSIIYESLTKFGSRT